MSAWWIEESAAGRSSRLSCRHGEHRKRWCGVRTGARTCHQLGSQNNYAVRGAEQPAAVQAGSLRSPPLCSGGSRGLNPPGCPPRSPLPVSSEVHRCLFGEESKRRRSPLEKQQRRSGQHDLKLQKWRLQVYLFDQELRLFRTIYSRKQIKHQKPVLGEKFEVPPIERTKTVDRENICS